MDLTDAHMFTNKVLGILFLRPKFQGLLSWWNFLVLATVALSFVFNNYYPIIYSLTRLKKIVSQIIANYAISYFFIYI
jgi:hypothetical protein